MGGWDGLEERFTEKESCRLLEREKKATRREKFEEGVERLGDVCVCGGGGGGGVHSTHKVQVVFVTCPNYLP